jgi:hypothetical protein
VPTLSDFAPCSFTPLSALTTRMGLVEPLMDLAVPRAPSELLPQHQTLPRSPVVAQVVQIPAASIDLTFSKGLPRA